MPASMASLACRGSERTRVTIASTSRWACAASDAPWAAMAPRSKWRMFGRDGADVAARSFEFSRAERETRKKPPSRPCSCLDQGPPRRALPPTGERSAGSMCWGAGGAGPSAGPEPRADNADGAELPMPAEVRAGRRPELGPWLGRGERGDDGRPRAGAPGARAAAGAASAAAGRRKPCPAPAGRRWGPAAACERARRSTAARCSRSAHRQPWQAPTCRPPPPAGRLSRPPRR